MKYDSPPDSKAMQERFTDLGKQLLAVPRSEVAERDKKWHARKAVKRKKR